jgi:hypothetical protein
MDSLNKMDISKIQEVKEVQIKLTPKEAELLYKITQSYNKIPQALRAVDDSESYLKAAGDLLYRLHKMLKKMLDLTPTSINSMCV